MIGRALIYEYGLLWRIIESSEDEHRNTTSIKSFYQIFAASQEPVLELSLPSQDTGYQPPSLQLQTNNPPHQHFVINF
jgi:hypothetical protein